MGGGGYFEGVGLFPGLCGFDLAALPQEHKDDVGRVILSQPAESR